MPTKHYTYQLHVSLKMQFTFDGSEVEQSDDGGDGDISPTDAALETARREIEECLVEEFGGVDEIEVSADFDDLLGVDDKGA